MSLVSFRPILKPLKAPNAAPKDKEVDRLRGATNYHRAELKPDTLHGQNDVNILKLNHSRNEYVIGLESAARTTSKVLWRSST